MQKWALVTKMHQHKFHFYAYINNKKNLLSLKELMIQIYNFIYKQFCPILTNVRHYKPNTDTDTAGGESGQVLSTVLGENEDELWHEIKQLGKCPLNIHFWKEDDDLFGIWFHLLSAINVFPSVSHVGNVCLYSLYHFLQNNAFITEFVLKEKHVFGVQGVFGADSKKIQLFSKGIKFKQTSI